MIKARMVLPGSLVFRLRNFFCYYTAKKETPPPPRVFVHCRGLVHSRGSRKAEAPAAGCGVCLCCFLDTK